MFYKQLIGNLIGIWLSDPEKDCEFLDLFCKDMNSSWNGIEWECNLPITAMEQPSPFHLLKCRPGDFFLVLKSSILVPGQTIFHVEFQRSGP